MKSTLFILLIVLIITGMAFFSCNQKPPAVKTTSEWLLEQTDSFSSVCKQFRAAAENPSSEEKELQDLFLKTRLAYKRFEWAAEYFMPATARLANGPPVPEVEMPGLNISDPAGLQLIEPCLFPHYDSTRKKIFLRQVDLLQST